MAEFWRVEDRETGDGPYTWYTQGTWPRDYSIEVPPIEDGLSVWAHYDSHYFGFQNKELLNRWMVPYILPSLDRNFPGRYVVRKFDVPEYAQLGRHQATVDRNLFGEPVEEYELCDIYNQNIIAVKEA